MTRSLRIRGLPGQLQLGRESRTFSGEGPPTWPSTQDIRDDTQGNLTGKKPASRENGAGLSKFEEKVRNRQEIQKKEIRSEEHTSELQSRQYLVCRLLLEKKKNSTYSTISLSI